MKLTTTDEKLRRRKAGKDLIMNIREKKKKHLKPNSEKCATRETHSNCHFKCNNFNVSRRASAATSIYKLKTQTSVGQNMSAHKWCSPDSLPGCCGS
jgi:hypothetical protein